MSAPYVSKTADADGRFNYDAEETDVWRTLYTRQMKTLAPFACRAYLDGQAQLGFSPDHIPQVSEVDARLGELTGAGVEPVAALIPQKQFSTLLSQRRFPVATFIRRREDLDYIEEPDIFHEVFGHCPMLTDPEFCKFMERFGELALSLPAGQIKRLYRLWWFTVEFGLIREDGQIKAFGAGIMSSPSEAAHAAAGQAETLPFDLLTIFRTDYRIDIVQPVYFVIDDFGQLAESLNADIPSLLEEAERKGDLPRRFDLAA
ncbi:MAG: phenylalanine 4-monooxygenase [Paracoccaceae bacterium]|nr:phenylalanine 4-monooxygenase [Paracoccaceae bacterium]